METSNICEDFLTVQANLAKLYIGKKIKFVDKWFTDFEFSDSAEFLLCYSTPTFVVDLEKEKTEAKEVSDDEPALPSLVKEGVHFNFDVPDRIYLDSYPEFHLNLHMVLSYLCLCHVENHALIIVRRMLWTFVSWMTIGLGLFYYSYYFPVLLKEPVTTFIVQYIILPFVPNAFEGRSNLMALIFYLLILPLIITIALFVLLAPILWKKQSISLTLLQKGDLRFFGKSFP